MTLTAAEKKTLRDSIVAEVVRITKDNELIVEHSYFYRANAGGSVEAFAENIARQVRMAGFIPISFKGEDHFNAWPKRSFFRVTFELSVMPPMVQQ